jgi:hypothetical protein
MENGSGWLESRAKTLVWTEFSTTAAKEVGMMMKKEWRFLSFRWWLVHFIGFSVVYAAGRVVSTIMRG